MVHLFYKLFTFIFDPKSSNETESDECLKCKMIIAILIMTPSHFLSLYFVLVFGNIYQNNQLPMIIYFVFSFLFMIFCLFIICIIAMIFRYLGIKHKIRILLLISKELRDLI